MTTLNHNRPYLQCIDNIKRVIAELDSWHKPKKNLATTTHDGVIRKKSVPANSYRSGKTKIITGADFNIHTVACSILAHVHMHREVSLCNKLVSPLKGFRKTALVAWFCEFGEVTAQNPITKKIGTELFFRKNHETKQIKAEANPYWGGAWGLD